jgi:hypothetical protein
MKRHLVSLAYVVVACAALVSAQSRSQQPVKPPPVERPTAQEVSLTGCVVEGVTADVYILTNAVERPGSAERPRTFRLFGAGEDMDFMRHLNQQVQVSGTAELRTPPPPPPGGEVSEKDLPTLTVKSIEAVGDRCSSR